MKSEWKTIRAADFMEFNPRRNLKKGTIATKISMDAIAQESNTATLDNS